MEKSIRRRRHEAKTDYKLRLGLLKSGKSRLAVRKTNKYIIAQIVSTSGAQDKILFGVTSKDLLSNGWPTEKSGSLKSLPAAYLTGKLLASRSKGKTQEVLLDIGMHRNIQKSRLYAVLKGAVDSGMKIPHSPDALPDDSLFEKNANLRDIFAKIKGSTVSEKVKEPKKTKSPSLKK